ncbi:MAG: translation initiation factor IF-2 [Thermodesulfobacteriota bacterium]|nr:translation initiation factor IF-2 [Thermodesulfobacteriota bacterium]
MAKIRVYELAKKLNMTNKALLTKLKAMNIEVKSHMSSLENDTVQEVKEGLFGSKKKETDIRVKTSVIRRRKTKARDTSDRPPSEADSASDEPEDNRAPASKGGKNTSDMQTSSEMQTSSSRTGKTETLKPEPDQNHRAVQQGEDASETAGSLAGPDQTDGGNKKAPASQEEKNKKEKDAKTEHPKEIPAEKQIDLDSGDAPLGEKEAAPLLDDKKSEDDKQTDNKKPDQAGEDQNSAASHEKKEESLEKNDKKKKKKKKKKTTEPARIIKKAVIPVVKQTRKKVKPEKKTEKPIESGPKKKTIPEKKTPAKKDTKKPASPVKEEDFAPGRETGRSKKKDWKKKGTKPEVFYEPEGKKAGSRKKKSVVEGKDLYEKKSFSGKKRRKKDFKVKKKGTSQKTQITTPRAIKRRIKIDETIELAELAKRMGIKANEMIQKLMGLGVMVTVNQTIDFDTASLVAAEFGYEVEKASFEEDLLINAQQAENDDLTKSKPRPPVVTIMGHVDHGKTSLLDVIRKSKITTGEAGGITQHIGAYSVEIKNGVITFLDTPGHAAFTSMRSRGAQVTDIVVLVVAADDGVMPQTIEAINHSKAAGVPVVVAVNKMDKPDAQPDKVIRQLSEHGLVAEEWGGDIIFARVSAKTETGIDELLEMILLQAEVLELNANPDRLASGHVVESRLDAGRGPIATILVQHGTLKTGQAVVCGLHSGRIRAMIGDTGLEVETAGPSTPVEIVGLSGVPEAGDEFFALDSEKDAKQISEHRMQKDRAKDLAKKNRANLEKLFANMGSDEIKELKLIVKADVHGSIEALSESLIKLSQEEVSIKIIHSGTGAINESDVSLAAVSDAIIIGFNVRPSPKVRTMAKEENVDIRFCDIIYNVINDIKAAITGLMPSTFQENIIGRAEVRDIFVIPGKGTIAGSFVLEGKIGRGLKTRLIRDGIVKCDSLISSLKRFKDDAKEVVQGYECGIGIEKFNNIKVEDIIECYEIEEKRPEMEPNQK